MSPKSTRLWQTATTTVDQAIAAFTVGDDPALDQQLLPYDCLASAAHAAMLARAGVLTESERKSLTAALAEARIQALAGTLVIAPEQEDAHTALEAFLTQRLGDLGKAIHTARSRNDQVIMALKLLVRERVLAVAAGTGALVEALVARGAEERSTLMPGYSHTRQAMPSSFGQLLFATAESLVGDAGALLVPLELANRSAAGSAAGYGVPLVLDRDVARAALGMSALELNTLHAQQSRGKLEAAVLFALHQLSLTLSRFAADLIWFSSEAFGFVRLPDPLTTGSSIMPQKKNPDLLELVRQMSAGMLGRYTEITASLHGLTSGYHRDLQRTKGPLLRALQEAVAGLSVVRLAVEGIEVDRERCTQALRDEILATDRVYARVRQGEAFRDAYRRVKEGDTTAIDPTTLLAARAHAGAPGSDQSMALRQTWDTFARRLAPVSAAAAKAWALLEP